MNACTIDGKDLLAEIKAIRKKSYSTIRKKKNESDRDYIIRKAGNRCSFCRIRFPKEKLSVVKRDPKRELPKRKNGMCVCRDCGNEKGSMSEREYLRYLAQKKRELRRAVYDNYPHLREVVFSKYHYQCIYCKIQYGENHLPEGRKLTIDHKVPVSRGGGNDVKNLCCACEEHNFDKRDKTAEEYIDLLLHKKKETMHG